MQEVKDVSEKISVSWNYSDGTFKDLITDTQEALYPKSGLTLVVCTFMRPDSIERLLNSLFDQSSHPVMLIVVDASTNNLTEHTVREIILMHDKLVRISFIIQYFRVAGSLRGLTRQRNFALAFVKTDLVAFFDDDIVFESDCLKELESAIRRSDDVVGVGARILDEDIKPGLFWNSLHWLRAMPDLKPGRYHRSGLIAPLRLLGDHQNEMDVDRLPGCCMLWYTNLARNQRFNEFFCDYSQSEDLEFSLRTARYGRLIISGKAQVRHLHATQGRLDQIRLGRMGVVNRHFIHRTTLPNRQWQDVLSFIYAQILYVLFTTLSMFLQRRFSDGLRYAWGALLGVRDILRGTG